MRPVLGWVLGVIAWVWLRTLRLTLDVHPDLRALPPERPWVLVFFHGKQWPLLAWKRRRPTLVMVSHSKDGELQCRALTVLGFDVVRGSSSRGGARGLAALVRLLRPSSGALPPTPPPQQEPSRTRALRAAFAAPVGAPPRRGVVGSGASRPGFDAAFAVDGPRGPYGIAKPGALMAARAVNAAILPMGSAVAGGLVLKHAWDRFALAWPFGRVAVVLGAPLGEGSDSGTMEQAIAAANLRAESLLAAPRTYMVASEPIE